MSDKMTIDADVMRNICSNLSSMIELLDPGAPVDEVSEEPPEELQGKSVVDRGSREIEVRWAKETIGLVANELNRAYTEIEITRDGHTIPGGLGNTFNRLEEAMKCLGLTDEIPF